jgi:hypothetical protein
VKVLRIVPVAVLLLAAAHGVKSADEAQRLELTEKFYSQQKWEEALLEAQGPPDQSAEFDYFSGMALARLGRWAEARSAFSNGAGKAPSDARFLTERAGTEYKLNDFRAAKTDLRRALRLDPNDSYVPGFLGIIYLLEGNAEAALKFWNVVNKPQLAEVEAVPKPKAKEQLLDRAIPFSPPGVLERESFLKANALLENLEVFPQWRTEISPARAHDSSSATADEYRATLRLNERNGWGSSMLDGAISLLRGTPYQTVYPTYYNLRGEVVNVYSLARWDSEKRRVFGGLSFPLFRQPSRRLRIFFDARNENWNLSQTFLGSSALITDLNMKRFAGGAELHVVESGRWDLSVGLEGVSREFQNVAAVLPSAAWFFQDSRGVNTWLGVHRSIIRFAERRYTLDGKAEVRAGRNYAPGLGAFSSMKGELKSRWLPRARGEDYEFLSSLRSGGTFGDVPLDELYQLGVERDNDLWMRGHSGTIDGRKGRAPLGRRYVLLNSEVNKTLYDGAFFRVQLGPFFDTGAIADPSGQFGSRKWLFDAGIQARIRVLGSVGVVLSYGRDLRNGTGVFYGTSVR